MLNKESIEKVTYLFGKDWYEVLKDELHTKTFLDVSKAIQNERKKYTIYPESVNVFRAFRETGYLNMKVVLLGMDPYHDSTANGLSFCCSDSLKINPSLRIILKEIDREYPENIEDLSFGRIYKQNLTRWTKQGVLLLNATLTVRKGNPGSHKHIWQDFMNSVIKKISKKEDIIFILLGKDAQEYKQYLEKNVKVFEAPHPAAEIYSPGIGFIGSGIFRKVNEHLKATNKKEIEW